MAIIGKAISFAAIAVGQVEGPLLTRYVDNADGGPIAKRDTTKYPSPLHYPLYMRAGVMVPLVSGIATLVLGFAGERLLPGKLKESTLEHLLEYGTSATVGALLQVLDIAEQRKAAGMAQFNPKANGTAPPVVPPANGQGQMAQYRPALRVITS